MTLPFRKPAALALAIAPLVLTLTGCAGLMSKNPPIEMWDDMKRQPKYKPEMESAFFSDHRTSRRPVEGTIARGHLRDNDVAYTGIENNMYIGKNPLPLDKDVMALGQKKFNIYCTPCHDRTGSGQGVVPVRTNWLPTNLQEDRVRGFNDGEIFNVISFGRRNMPAYRFQIPEHDRWAIVYYVRALQRASRASIADIPPDRLADVKDAPPPPPKPATPPPDAIPPAPAGSTPAPAGANPATPPAAAPAPAPAKEVK